MANHNNVSNNIPLVLIGLGLFGLDGLVSMVDLPFGANEQAGLAVLNAFGWMYGGDNMAILEYYDKEKGRASLIGMATGVLVGLASVTPQLVMSNHGRPF